VVFVLSDGKILHPSGMRESDLVQNSAWQTTEKHPSISTFSNSDKALPFFLRGKNFGIIFAFIFV